MRRVLTRIAMTRTSKTILLVMLLLAGCGMASRLRALREVEFQLDRIDGVRVAGMDLTRLRSFDDLEPAQVAIIAAGALAGEVPLDLELVLQARNPSINSDIAELFAMDWTLLLDDRETVSGRWDRRVQIRPGQIVELPMKLHLNLTKFFGRDGKTLIDVLRAAIGERSRPINIGLRATPLIGTPFGPMRYPAPITIVRRVGSSEF